MSCHNSLRLSAVAARGASFAGKGKLLCLMPICFIYCLFWLSPVQAEPGQGTLTINNQNCLDLINLRFEKKGEIFFVRLDLPPKAYDDIENPAVTIDIRADWGLMLDSFPAVPLDTVKHLTFCGEHQTCLILERAGRSPEHRQGRRQYLLPQNDARPVCMLSQFKPGMTMQDVCSLFSPDPPRDDNEAILTGLGFADMLWAARLTPAQSTPAAAEGHSILGHLELRRPLDAKDLHSLLQTLYRQGYAPWQAELPGLDMDFSEMTDVPLPRKKSLLEQALQHFMDVGKDEASIMLAPAEMLPSLADADMPQTDVQLFTLTLRQASRTLVVDVASYQGNSEK